ncbi:hypothetical protein EV363DRAFT_1401778 [Boletus edulis]|nr:hypothetical protein EV363DRAFT_1401778 [Boletus edulis]
MLLGDPSYIVLVLLGWTRENASSPFMNQRARYTRGRKRFYEHLGGRTLAASVDWSRPPNHTLLLEGVASVLRGKMVGAVVCASYGSICLAIAPNQEVCNQTSTGKASFLMAMAQINVGRNHDHVPHHVCSSLGNIWRLLMVDLDSSSNHEVTACPELGFEVSIGMKNRQESDGSQQNFQAVHSTTVAAS